MQYTYEEAVRELSDFLGKHVTADNFWKMEQILLTVLREVEVSESEYDIGYPVVLRDYIHGISSNALGLH